MHFKVDDEDDWEDIEEDEISFPAVNNKVEVFSDAEVVVSRLPLTTPHITTTTNSNLTTIANTATSNEISENVSVTNITSTKVLSNIINSSPDLNDVDKDLSDEETHESFQKFIEENTLRVDPVCCNQPNLLYGLSFDIIKIQLLFYG